MFFMSKQISVPKHFAQNPSIIDLNLALKWLWYECSPNSPLKYTCHKNNYVYCHNLACLSKKINTYCFVTTRLGNSQKIKCVIQTSSWLASNGVMTSIVD